MKLQKRKITIMGKDKMMYSKLHLHVGNIEVLHSCNNYAKEMLLLENQSRKKNKKRGRLPTEKRGPGNSPKSPNGNVHAIAWTLIVSVKLI
jgi:hypothetical protein